MISISRVHYPVTSLGVGRRAGIWFQGCSIGCRGCVSSDTWVASSEHERSVGDLMDWIRSLPKDELDGLTISGGEPFEQPDQLRELLSQFREYRDQIARPVDILCFSGNTFEHLQNFNSDILELLDVVVPGRFVESRPTNLIWRGSSNQELVLLSELGATRYAEFADYEPAKKPMQVAVDGDGIWWIGIPGRSDMDELTRRMAERGVFASGQSW
jgi:anaerobic ribonucleoside-triphosphate reductase activating protein